MRAHVLTKSIVAVAIFISAVCASHTASAITLRMREARFKWRHFYPVPPLNDKDSRTLVHFCTHFLQSQVRFPPRHSGTSEGEHGAATAFVDSCRVDPEKGWHLLPPLVNNWLHRQLAISALRAIVQFRLLLSALLFGVKLTRNLPSVQNQQCSCSAQRRFVSLEIPNANESEIRNNWFHEQQHIFFQNTKWTTGLPSPCWLVNQWSAHILEEQYPRDCIEPAIFRRKSSSFLAGKNPVQKRSPRNVLIFAKVLERGGLSCACSQPKKQNTCGCNRMYTLNKFRSAGVKNYQVCWKCSSTTWASTHHFLCKLLCSRRTSKTASQFCSTTLKTELVNNSTTNLFELWSCVLLVKLLTSQMHQVRLCADQFLRCLQLQAVQLEATVQVLAENSCATAKISLTSEHHQRPPPLVSIQRIHVQSRRSGGPGQLPRGPHTRASKVKSEQQNLFGTEASRAKRKLLLTRKPDPLPIFINIDSISTQQVTQGCCF